MAKSEIIKQLARGEVSTDLALKQLKVLLTDFPNDELLNWVNSELYGYDNDTELPSYRKAIGILKGSFLCGYSHVNNAAIPLDGDTPEELLNYCSIVEFHESISSLQELANSKELKLVKPVPSNFIPYVMKYSLITMTALLEAKVEFGTTAITNILSVVNNKVLDTLLLLEKEFGNLDELDIDISSFDDSKIDEINKGLQIIVYNNSISIGDNNSIAKSEITSE